MGRDEEARGAFAEILRQVKEGKGIDPRYTPTKIEALSRGTRARSQRRSIQPPDSGPGFRRLVVVVQGDALNRSHISTVVCVPLTSNLKWAGAPGNIALPARLTGLPKDSLANGSQIVSVDKEFLTARVGRLPQPKLLLLSGIDVILGK